MILWSSVARHIPILSQAICRHLDVDLAPSTLNHFSNGCMQVQLDANCREADVFIIQPIVPPVHDNLMELLQMLDAVRGASAARTTAVIPYYGYARSDKKVVIDTIVGDVDGKEVIVLDEACAQEPVSRRIPTRKDVATNLSLQWCTAKLGGGNGSA